ncbi:MAG: prephenate dehydrogenase [Clostridia bacterium]|nr:prephenate dehydrogenase [Clostridia bacterium]
MKIGIIGLGLIGGSIGRAVLSKTNDEVFGRDINPAALLKAKLLRAVSDELTDEKLRETDLLVLAVNPRAAQSVLPSVLPLLKKGATVIDCCGNKRGVVAVMKELANRYPDIGFIATHPMAGREFSGIEHSTPKLYEKSFVILTPVKNSIHDFEKVKGFYLSIGCEGVTLASAEEHDEMISYTSQLAHVLSSSYVKNPLSSSHAGFSAGSFRDLTRVAKLSPSMWTELFIDNGDNLTKQIQDLIDRLEEYKKAIEEKDEKTLFALLQDGTEKKAAAENALKEKRKEEK